MKLLQFLSNGHSRLGLMLEGKVYDLADVSSLMAVSLPATLQQAMSAPRGYYDQAIGTLGQSPALAVPEKEVVFLPCVPNPQKIICIGLNYRDHAAETGVQIPEEPVVFSKFSNALAGHRQTVRMPSKGTQVDYEAELVIVMGRQARNVSPAQALDYVFGYTVGNDLSVRDLQFRTGQWLIGKTPDGFAPIGPCITTADEVPDPQALAISCRVNGQVRQSSHTGQMIFSCAEIISHLSGLMTLEPGDLIFTGTPHGVALGYPEGQQPWLRAGDQVVCEIEGLGKLTSYFM